jgi:DNA-binding GntR family transcriptional regulator
MKKSPNANNVSSISHPTRTRAKPGPAKSSANEAYDLLIAAIERGDLTAGMRMREVELAERYGISRTPIREALKRLEAQGLVTHTPNQGAVVTTLDFNQMAELYLMREILEGTAARLAATRATDTEIEVLTEMIDSDRRHPDNPRLLARTNRKFHRQLQLSARNSFLSNTLENMQLSHILLVGTTLADPERGRQSFDEHAAIVRGIREHDPDAAEAAARAHVRYAFKWRMTQRSA